MSRYVKCKKQNQDANKIIILNEKFENITKEYIPESEKYILTLDTLEKKITEKSKFCSIENAMKQIGYIKPGNRYRLN